MNSSVNDDLEFYEDIKKSIDKQYGVDVIARGERKSYGESTDTAFPCYLSIADYWVTNDREAKENLEESVKYGLIMEKEIKNRILTWDEFLTKLSKKDLKPGLAPCSTRSYRYLENEKGEMVLSPI